MISEYRRIFYGEGAISANQAEGAYREGGRGISNIDLIPHGSSRMDVKLGKVSDPELQTDAFYPSHEAIDFYHHYKEDLALMGNWDLKGIPHLYFLVQTVS